MKRIASGALLFLGDFSFEIILYPCGFSEADGGNENDVGVFISRCDTDKGEAIADFRIQLINQRGKSDVMMVKSDGPSTFPPGNLLGCKRSVPMAFLQDEAYGIRVNDVVIVRAWMLLSLGCATERKSKPCIASTLGSDLQETLNSGAFSDVVVECGGQNIQCHSQIMMARSPVFMRMLQADMLEAQTHTVKVDDIDPKAMREFLRFLYTDKISTDVESDDDVLCHILHAAHKYEVSSLADFCESLVEQRLSMANVVDRLRFADLHDRQKLRHSCLAFITRTPAVVKEVQATDAFEHLCETRPKLLKDILAMATGSLSTRKRQSPPDAFEFPNGSDWARLSLANLKKACQERGLSDSGVKAALRLRLESQTSIERG